MKWKILRSRCLQILKLPLTLWRIHQLVKQEYTDQVFDEGLWAFRGFHAEPWDPHFQMRPWIPVEISKIGPDQVVDIFVQEMTEMVNVAMEIEDPITEYSLESGEGFRHLLPNLGRFMGKSESQARFAREHGLPWCESAWCSEERRHGPLFARLAERISGKAPDRSNPHGADPAATDEAGALKHIITRETTEWNASSTYVLFATHASGALRAAILNPLRDEIKHFAIISAVDRYLLGPRPWKRFWDLCKEVWRFVRIHKTRRSTGQSIGANGAILVEVIGAHLMTELRIRSWMDTLPLMTLREIFDAPSSLPDLESEQVDPETRARLAVIQKNGLERRRALERWSPSARQAMLEQEAFEKEFEGRIENIMRDALSGFTKNEKNISGWEELTNSEIWEIESFGAGLGKKLRLALTARLRDHHIRHNRHIVNRDAEALKSKRHFSSRHHRPSVQAPVLNGLA